MRENERERKKERKKKEKRARVAQFTVDVIDLSGYHLIARDLFPRLASPYLRRGECCLEGDVVRRGGVARRGDRVG